MQNPRRSARRAFDFLSIDMNWITLDETLVLADMPSDLAPQYEAWILALPTKAGRLAAITAYTVSEFRAAIAMTPGNVLPDDTTQLPEPCIRYAETIVYHALSMEMGLALASEAVQIKAQTEMYLRQLRYGHFRTEAFVSGSPSYTAPNTDYLERSL